VLKTTNKSYCLESLISFARNISITLVSGGRGGISMRMYDSDWFLYTSVVSVVIILLHFLLKKKLVLPRPWVEKMVWKTGGSLSTSKILSTPSLHAILKKSVEEILLHLSNFLDPIMPTAAKMAKIMQVFL